MQKRKKEFELEGEKRSKGNKFSVLHVETNKLFC
jgi:hypothetical protein